jgi:septal ring-binding cell division protein DamX
LALWWHSPVLLESLKTFFTAPPVSIIAVAENVFTARLQASQRWLTQAEPQHYSLQVMYVAEEKTDELLKLLKKPEVQTILERLYIYKIRNNKGNILWSVVYHEFNDANTANAAVATLPEILRRNQPFPRSLASLREKQVP